MPWPVPSPNTVDAVAIHNPKAVSDSTLYTDNSVSGSSSVSMHSVLCDGIACMLDPGGDFTCTRQNWIPRSSFDVRNGPMGPISMHGGSNSDLTPDPRFAHNIHT